MKIIEFVGNGIAVFAERRAGDARALGKPRHVIDDRVGINVYARGLAAIHHVGELLARAAAAFDPVADGLVARPPGGARDVLVRRRGLDGRNAGRTEVFLALPCDVIPVPLE